MEILIGDTKVKLKDRYCALNGGTERTAKEPYVNIFVRMTDRCTANCPFCDFHDNGSPIKSFDTQGFCDAYKAIRAKCNINKVAITGGEPLYNLNNTLAVAEHLKRVSPEIPVTINTNGFTLGALEDKVGLFSDIALSVHHFKSKFNDAIFRGDHASFDTIRRFKHPEKLHLRCNMMKGYIDTAEKIQAFMEYFAGTMGITDFGFVALRKVNAFCRERFIDYQDIGIEDLDTASVTRRLSYDKCSCCNYLGNAAGRLVRFYARTDLMEEKCGGILVWDRNKLTDGFGGKTICL